LGTAVNAADDGKWQWSSQGYDTWPSVDLYCPNGAPFGAESWQKRTAKQLG
jgi:hypothetical protein